MVHTGITSVSPRGSNRPRYANACVASLVFCSSLREASLHRTGRALQICIPPFCFLLESDSAKITISDVCNASSAAMSDISYTKDLDLDCEPESISSVCRADDLDSIDQMLGQRKPIVLIRKLPANSTERKYRQHHRGKTLTIRYLDPTTKE